MARSNEPLVKKKGLRAAFITGRNSTCRYHVRKHYNVYSTRCKEARIAEHHWAVDRNVWEMMQAKATGKTGKTQTKIDAMFGKGSLPKEFTRDGILHAVAQFIICDDQVSANTFRRVVVLMMFKSLAMADKATFQNCLVSMRMKTITKELPSTHNVWVYVHNKFVEHLRSLKKAFMVSGWQICNKKHTTPAIKHAPGKISITADGWTADTTSHAFLGMTAHWIDVETQEVEDGMTKEVWTLQSAMIGFHGISGGHDGGNMGRYFMGVTDRVGITGKNHSKVTCTVHLLPVLELMISFPSCLSQHLITHQATERLARPSKRSTTSASWNNGTLRRINICGCY